MPEVGLEPTWTQGPLDFESSASTDFTTPAKDFVILAHPRLQNQEQNPPANGQYRNQPRHKIAKRYSIKRGL